MKTEFSTLDIVKGLNIPRERLREWQVKGFIKPRRPASGKGTRAVFTIWEVYGVALFRMLIESGFDRKFAAEFIHWFLITITHADSSVAYIGFRYFTPSHYNPDQNKQLKLFFYDNKWNLDLRSCMAIPMKIAESNPGFFQQNDDWDQFHMVNFGKIRAQVDSAMGKVK